MRTASAASGAPVSGGGENPVSGSESGRRLASGTNYLRDKSEGTLVATKSIGKRKG